MDIQNLSPAPNSTFKCKILIEDGAVSKFKILTGKTLWQTSLENRMELI